MNSLKKVEIEASSKSCRKAAADLAEAFGIKIQEAGSPSETLKATISYAAKEAKRHKEAKKRLKKKIKAVKAALEEL